MTRANSPIHWGDWTASGADGNIARYGHLDSATVSLRVHPRGSSWTGIVYWYPMRADRLSTKHEIAEPKKTQEAAKRAVVQFANKIARGKD